MFAVRIRMWKTLGPLIASHNSGFDDGFRIAEPAAAFTLDSALAEPKAMR